MATEGSIQVTLVYCPAPRKVKSVVLDLPLGATLLDALKSEQAQPVVSGLDLQRATLGVWGRQARACQVLQAQDRIEIYRPLTVDPKVARRERFVKQGVKKAGLFANKRPGAKAGY